MLQYCSAPKQLSLVTRLENEHKVKLVDASIKNPITVIVGVILVVMFGFIALLRIPVQLTPNVDKAEITVNTLWAGASPQEVEREIIDEQEDVLKSVEGLVEMKSESFYGRGTVTLKFQVGTDPDAALLKVSNNLNQVPEVLCIPRPNITIIKQCIGLSEMVKLTVNISLYP